VRLALVAIVVALVVLVLGGGTALAGAGSLDTSFSFGGKVTTPIGSGTDVAQAVALQPDGKIVAAGNSISGFTDRFALARYNPNGSLDTSFDGDGKLTTAIGSGNENAYAVAIQPDGKIVAAGYSSNGSDYDFALARYNANGSLDTSFDGDGKQTTAIGGSDDVAFAVALQPDGKIVAAGQSFNGSNDDFALARYNANGSLDTSFDGDGKQTTAIGSGNENAYAVAIQPDGKIVAAGRSSNGSDDDLALVRYNANGSLDSSFDGDGKQTTAFGSGNDDAYAVAIQPDGKIVAAGYGLVGSVSEFALARYNPDGSLDSSFDGDGKQTTAIGSGDAAYAVAIQPDGKIVAAGNSFNGSDVDFGVARYNPNGSLDIGFGGGGELTTQIGSGNDFGAAAALQPDGRIVVAGSSSNGSDYDFALARYDGADLTLAPGRVEPGGSLVASGSGWYPHEAVDVYLDTTEVALAGSDQFGSIQTKLKVPASIAPDVHWVTAVGRLSGYTVQNSVLVVSDWPMFRFGAAHAGANPFENTLSTGNASSLRLLWRVKLGTSGSHVTPASVGGVVYGVGPDGRVYALDGTSGAQLWQSASAAANTDSAPAANGQSVFVGSTNLHTYAFNAATGAARWTNSNVGSVSAPITLASGAVFTASTDTKKVYALEPATGAKRTSWTAYTALGPVRGAPAVADGSLVFATGAPDNRIVALDDSTGALQWQAGPFTGADFVSSPAIDGGAVYVGGQDGNLYARRLDTGGVLWTATIGSAIISSPAVSNGIVYAGAGDNKLYAYDADTGAAKWNQTFGAPVGGSPAIANGLLAVTVPSTQKLVLVNAASGAKLRGLSTRADPSSPIIVNGTIYLSSTGGLSAYGLTPGYASASRPDPRTLRPNPNLQPAQPGATSR